MTTEGWSPGLEQPIPGEHGHGEIAVKIDDGFELWFRMECRRHLQGLVVAASSIAYLSMNEAQAADDRHNPVIVHVGNKWSAGISPRAVEWLKKVFTDVHRMAYMLEGTHPVQKAIRDKMSEPRLLSDYEVFLVHQVRQSGYDAVAERLGVRAGSFLKWAAESPNRNAAFADANRDYRAKAVATRIEDKTRQWMATREDLDLDHGDTEAPS